MNTMSSRGFTFKQFHIEHDQCAMKVGTDGILLGAWAPLAEAQRILDVGTGSGLIALMLAQRSQPAVNVVGLELDRAAAKQAAQNVAASPWAQQIDIVPEQVQDYSPTTGFDLLVSNPPYFTPGLALPKTRSQARYNETLSLAELFAHARRLLTPTGRIALILPVQAQPEAIVQAAECNFYLHTQTAVITKQGKSPTRFLLLFTSSKCCTTHNELVINTKDSGLSSDYVSLVSPFYLKM